MEVRFTKTARAQFLQALRFIARDKPSASKIFRAKAEKSLARLIEFPDSGRPLPEFPDPPFREIIVSPYRFFYRLGENSVIVVGVWHSAQLPGKPQ
jgi:toxin ParE1/3/4